MMVQNLWLFEHASYTSTGEGWTSQYKIKCVGWTNNWSQRCSVLMMHVCLWCNVYFAQYAHFPMTAVAPFYKRAEN